MTEDAAEREYREQAWKEHMWYADRESFMAGFDAARTFYNEWTPDAMPASKW